MPKDDQIPYFHLYVDDFVSDGKVEAMTTEEVGAYFLLLCKSWREKPAGSIPEDDRILARWTRLDADRWQVCKARVLAAFTFGNDSRLHQKRLRKEYVKMIEARERRKQASQVAVEARLRKLKKRNVNDSYNESLYEAEIGNSSVVSVVVNNDSGLSEQPQQGVSVEALAGSILDLYPKYEGRMSKRKSAISEIIAVLTRRCPYETLRLAVINYANWRDGEDEKYTTHAPKWFKDDVWKDWDKPREKNQNGNGRHAPDKKVIQEPDYSSTDDMISAAKQIGEMLPKYAEEYFDTPEYEAQRYAGGATVYRVMEDRIREGRETREKAMQSLGKKRREWFLKTAKKKGFYVAGAEPQAVEEMF